MPVAMPFRAAASARLIAMVLFPTPPLALLTATTLLTLGIGRFSGKPKGRSISACYRMKGGQGLYLVSCVLRGLVEYQSVADPVEVSDMNYYEPVMMVVWQMIHLDAADTTHQRVLMAASF